MHAGALCYRSPIQLGRRIMAVLYSQAAWGSIASRYMDLIAAECGCVPLFRLHEAHRIREGEPGLAAIFDQPWGEN